MFLLPRGNHGNHGTWFCGFLGKKGWFCGILVPWFSGGRRPPEFFLGLVPWFSGGRTKILGFLSVVFWGSKAASENFMIWFRGFLAAEARQRNCRNFYDLVPWFSSGTIILFWNRARNHGTISDSIRKPRNQILKCSLALETTEPSLTASENHGTKS